MKAADVVRGLVWVLPLGLALPVQNLNGWRDYTSILAINLILAILLLAPFRKTQADNSRHETFTIVAMLLYLAAIAINPFLSQVPYFSEIGAALCSLLPLTFLAYLATRRFRSPLFRLNLNWIWLVAAALSIFGIHEAVMMGHRALGPYTDVNTLAALFNLAAIPLAAICISGQARQRHWALLTVLAIGLATANSKGAYLSLVLSLLAIVFCLRGVSGWKLRACAVAGALALAYIAITCAPGAHRDYGTEQAPSVMARLWMWKSALHAYWAEAPFSGTGLYTYKLLYAQYRDPREIFSSGDQAHNDYVQYLLEGGPALLLALLLVGPGLAIASMRRSARLPLLMSGARAEAIGLAGACLALSIHATVNFIYKTPILMVIAGLYLARIVEIQGNESTPSREASNRFLSKPVMLSAGLVALALVGFMARDGAIRWLTEETPAPVSRYFPNDTMARVERLAALSPSNPYPKVFLSAHLLEAARTESDPVVRHADLMNAHDVIQSWLDHDRFEIGAWLRLAEISRMDPTITGGTSPAQFLTIALSYRPANLFVRNMLIEELEHSGQPETACAAARQSTPWLAGTPLLLKHEIFRWASAGLKLCTPLASAEEVAFWQGLADQYTDAPQTELSPIIGH
ncbi:MAG: O-antigen polymerase [Nevskia sp.]|nr:O-antigen polymerase [Nevskia sp.]